MVILRLDKVKVRVAVVVASPLVLVGRVRVAQDSMVVTSPALVVQPVQVVRLDQVGVAHRDLEHKPLREPLWDVSLCQVPVLSKVESTTNHANLVKVVLVVRVVPLERVDKAALPNKADRAAQALVSREPDLSLDRVTLVLGQHRREMIGSRAARLRMSLA